MEFTFFFIPFQRLRKEVVVERKERISVRFKDICWSYVALLMSISIYISVTMGNSNITKGLLGFNFFVISFNESQKVCRLNAIRILKMETHTKIYKICINLEFHLFTAYNRIGLKEYERKYGKKED